MAATKESLDAIYSDKLMNTTCYHLHAVLVHQGQASGGHYWAYVRKPLQRSQGGRGCKSTDSSPEPAVTDVELESQSETEVEALTPQTGQTSSMNADTRTQCTVCEPESDSEVTGQTGQEASQTSPTDTGGELWLKFNDVSVTEVGWEEVQKESFGREQRNTSAYCLLYIDSAMRHQQMAGQSKEIQLSQQLQSCVDEDNSKFKTEMEEYNQKQREKEQRVSLVLQGLGMYSRTSFCRPRSEPRSIHQLVKEPMQPNLRMLVRLS